MMQTQFFAIRYIFNDLCADCTNSKVWFKICSALNSGYFQVLTPLVIRTPSPEKSG